MPCVSNGHLNLSGLHRCSAELGAGRRSSSQLLIAGGNVASFDPDRERTGFAQTDGLRREAGWRLSRQAWHR